jgi:hypothetical protein
MSKETKKDLVLLVITSVTSAIGMTSMFVDCWLLACIAIPVSDAYIFLVLLLAAILSEDDAFATRRRWISGFFPSRTGALFILSLDRLRLCRSVCRSRGFSIQQNVSRRTLHQSFHHGLY